MDKLFEEFDANDGSKPKGTMDAENQEILAKGENYVNVMANLEDELELLEAAQQHASGPKNGIKPTMDIERPPQKPAQTYRPAPAATHQSNAGFDSFIRTLYSRQKEREREKAFTFYKSEQNETEDKKHELDLNDNKAQVYLIDVQEDYQNKSRLLVYGKVKVKGQAPVSCCLAVNGMERRYYFFKKENEQVVNSSDLDYRANPGRSYEED